ncbi:MAG: hypothetical protein JO185_10810 [Acidobacteriaceae bacterium]|nr:hypothetical protein [Acidobacteriaceae bacterium]
MLTAALQAGRILEAWNGANSCCFEAELESALALCETGATASEMESEQQAVLQSVVQHIRQISLHKAPHLPEQCETGFFLLRHLHSRAAQAESGAQ